MNEMLIKLQAEEEANNIFKNRPPNMWNEPESLEEDHEMRCSANPFKIYRDDRIDKLYEFMKKAGDAIQVFEKDRWDNLVENVIQVFEYLENNNLQKQLEE